MISEYEKKIILREAKRNLETKIPELYGLVRKFVLTKEDIARIEQLQIDVKTWCRILGYPEDLDGIQKMANDLGISDEKI